MEILQWVAFISKENYYIKERADRYKSITIEGKG